MIELPDVPMARRIAPIFHRTYPVADLPPELRENVAVTERLHPDWEHRLYDDQAIEEFIAEHYGRKVLDLYASISPSCGAARADLFRYLVVYRFGGVYLDIKSRATRHLGSLIASSDKMILSHWDNLEGESHEGWGICAELGYRYPGEFQQWHIIAVAGHPYLRAAIEAVLTKIRDYSALRDGVGKPAVIRVTGPIAYTLALQPLLRSEMHRTVRVKQDLGLEYSFYPAGFTHVQHFPSHYTRSKERLVRPSNFIEAAAFPLMRAVHPAYDTARRVVWRLQRVWAC